MNIMEFMQQEAPIRKQSRLDPFCADILELNRSGYNLNQILAFLTSNEIQISKPVLHRYIQNRLKRQAGIGKIKAVYIPAQQEPKSAEPTDLPKPALPKVSDTDKAVDTAVLPASITETAQPGTLSEEEKKAAAQKKIAEFRAKVKEQKEADAKHLPVVSNAGKTALPVPIDTQTNQTEVNTENQTNSDPDDLTEEEKKEIANRPGWCSKARLKDLY